MRTGAAIVAALLLGAPVLTASAIDPADDALDSYLQSRGLETVRAFELERRLRRAQPDERASLIDELSALYVRRLETSQEDRVRREVLDAARRLVASAGEDETLSLRVRIARAAFETSERVAQLALVGDVGPSERAAAERELLQTRAEFESIATGAHRFVSAGEREERTAAGLDDAQETRLAEARSVRSMGRYYAGWAGYYLSVLSDRPAYAREALRDLGWLLNAEPGQTPMLDRVPTRNFRYAHIARAAIAVGLCESVLGEHVRALRWLDAVSGSEDLPEEVQAELLVSRSMVLARADRLPQLLAETRRVIETRALTAGEARLLAVLGMTAVREDQQDEPAALLARLGYESLVSAGALDQLLALVRRFGSAPLDGEGFVARYVRAIAAFERAEGEEAQRGLDDQSTRTRFEDAARAFDGAAAAGDAQGFAEHLARARLLAAVCVDRAGRSGEAWERLSALTTDGPMRTRRSAASRAVRIAERQRAALAEGPWESRLADSVRAVVALEPTSDRTLSLMIRHGDLLGEDANVVGTLLAVPERSPLYRTARERAGGILFRSFLNAQDQRRAAAGDAYVSVAQGLLAEDLELARADREGAGERAVSRARRVLSAMLDRPAPRGSAAESTLDAVRGLLIQGGAARGALQEHTNEFLLRESQAMAATGRFASALAVVDSIPQDDRYARVARSRLVERLDAALSDRPEDVALAALLVEAGLPMVVVADEPSTLTNGLSDRVAAAASTLWLLRQDERMRALALRLDRQAFDAGIAGRRQIRRLASQAESSGDRRLALDAWIRLLRAASPQSDPWYEARVESIRLTAEIDAPRARELLTQHAVLTPELGPSPWDERLRSLAREMGLGW
ncbi:MAG: hypothetical protein AAGG07_03710 [Planctomycetota bacterium]